MSVQPATISQSGNVRSGFLIAVTIAITLVAFGSALLELTHRWIYEEEFSHGFLIPVVSIWLLWTRREALAASMGRPSWAGPIIVLLAVVTHSVGEYSSLFVLSHLAFIAVLMGLVLACGGYSLLKASFVPIAFLIFAIPLPYFIEAKLTLQLQLISSQLGVDVIRLFNIPVYLEGNIIDLGNYQLQVVEACSGLRYLYPLLSLSFLAAYLFQAPIWQRALVFLSGIPITIAMNGFRIGMVGVTVDRWGPKMADGVLHFFEGWIIFVACAGILISEIYLLARLSGRTFFHVFHVPAISVKPSRTDEPNSHLALVSCLLLVAVAGIGVYSVAHRQEIIPDRMRFADFPVMIGAWQGHTSLLDPPTVTALGVNDYLLSDYSKQEGKPVNLYVAYYNTQRNGYTPHSPSVCLPGSGWIITRLNEEHYDTRADFPYNRAVIEKDGAKEIVYYWFDERGREVASEYWAKWYLFADAITKNRTDGSLIRLTTDVYPDETEHDADKRLLSFMREAVPALGPYLPSVPGTPPKSTSVTLSSLHR
jgi:exosortase D (VPLPA-CTERM-specific)